MMKAEIGFKRAEKADREFLLTLRKSTMTEHLLKANIKLTDEQHMMRIDEHFADSFIILFNGEPIGLVKLGVLSDRLHIRQLQILGEFCNIGIGTKVLNLVKEKARQRGGANYLECIAR